MPERIESEQLQTQSKKDESTLNLVDLTASTDSRSAQLGVTPFTQSDLGNGIFGTAAGTAGALAREFSPQLILGAESTALQQRITLGVINGKGAVHDWSIGTIQGLDNTIARTHLLENSLRDFGHTPTPMPEGGLPVGWSKDAVATRSAWLTDANKNLQARVNNGLYSRGTERAMGASHLVSAHLDTSARVAESATTAADIMAQRLPAPPRGMSPLDLSRRALAETSGQTSMMLEQVKANHRAATLNTQIWEHQLTRVGFDRTPFDTTSPLGRHNLATPTTWLEESALTQRKFLATNQASLGINHPELAKAGEFRVNAALQQVGELNVARGMDQKLAILHESESLLLRRARPQLGRAFAQGIAATGGVMATDFLTERAAANIFGENSDAVRAVRPNIYGTMATTAALMSGANWQTRLGRGVAVWAASKSLNFVFDKELRER